MNPTQTNNVNSVWSDDDSDSDDQNPKGNLIDMPQVYSVPKDKTINFESDEDSDAATTGSPNSGSDRFYPCVQVKVQTPEGEKEMSYGQAVEQGYINS